ncbi:DUF882 domain-containing protein [Thermodesulfovibrionales bacterium]|nr:DUF882 domain-containing protein [Thermodesulfovibrionales bacterium]MCL0040113.1 DUF882 domain-containing protein [Thermodesulfovibrionales bacterium]MCL0040747.1 DUF882 domain-containing protein [Thermodesulfovibrionales bacterium]MCL0049957.1 DUF882 domain-containing protein [Thermodesulfovibrionales bacterium]MCL0068243.1 DUF882 domain-containing protein [Thermodesulfovibrionales bacterium]
MISRRGFLKAIVVGAVVYPFNNILASEKTARTLNMRNIHTGETLNIKYYSAGHYDSKALEEINYLLRCRFTNEVKPICIQVLNLLYDIQSIFSIDSRNAPLQIISGFRSAVFNEYLRRLGRRVSLNSFHLHGRAIDFAIQGVSNRRVFYAARAQGVGGVGLYRGFVHIDSGPIRTW